MSQFCRPVQELVPSVIARGLSGQRGHLGRGSLRRMSTVNKQRLGRGPLSGRTSKDPIQRPIERALWPVAVGLGACALGTYECCKPQTHDLDTAKLTTLLKAFSVGHRADLYSDTIQGDYYFKMECLGSDSLYGVLKQSEHSDGEYTLSMRYKQSQATVEGLTADAGANQKIVEAVRDFFHREYMQSSHHEPPTGAKLRFIDALFKQGTALDRQGRREFGERWVRYFSGTLNELEGVFSSQLCCLVRDPDRLRKHTTFLNRIKENQDQLTGDVNQVLDGLFFIDDNAMNVETHILMAYLLGEIDEALFNNLNFLYHMWAVRDTSIYQKASGKHLYVSRSSLDSVVFDVLPDVPKEVTSSFARIGVTFTTGKKKRTLLTPEAFNKTVDAKHRYFIFKPVPFPRREIRSSRRGIVVVDALPQRSFYLPNKGSLLAYYSVLGFASDMTKERPFSSQSECLFDALQRCPLQIGNPRRFSAAKLSAQIGLYGVAVYTLKQYINEMSDGPLLLAYLEQAAPAFTSWYHSLPEKRDLEFASQAT